MKLNIGVHHPTDLTIDGLKDLVTRSSKYGLLFHGSDSLLMLSLLNIHRPDVLVFALSNRGADISPLITAVRRKWPQTRIMVTGDHRNINYVRQLIEVGADGFVHSTAGFHTLLEGCTRIAEGQIFFDPETERLLLKKIVYED